MTYPSPDNFKIDPLRVGAGNDQDCKFKLTRRQLSVGLLAALGGCLLGSHTYRLVDGALVEETVPR